MSNKLVPALIIGLALVLTACGESEDGARAAAAPAEPAAKPAPAEGAPEENPAPAPPPGKPAAAPAEEKPVAPSQPAVMLAAQEKTSNFKLGVVNLKSCFDRTKHMAIQDVDSELQAMAQDLTQRVKALEQKESLAKSKLGALDRLKQPRLWEDKRRELAVVQTQLKFEKELGRTRYVNFYNDKKIAVYNDVRKAVSQIAKQHGFDLILRVEEALLEEAEQTAPVSITQRINNRVVLYHNEGVDITPLVLKLLNDEYTKRKGAGNKK